MQRERLNQARHYLRDGDLIRVQRYGSIAGQSAAIQSRTVGQSDRGKRDDVAVEGGRCSQSCGAAYLPVDIFGLRATAQDHL